MKLKSSLKNDQGALLTQDPQEVKVELPHQVPNLIQGLDLDLGKKSVKGGIVKEVEIANITEIIGNLRKDIDARVVVEVEAETVEEEKAAKIRVGKTIGIKAVAVIIAVGIEHISTIVTIMIRKIAIVVKVEGVTCVASQALNAEP